MSLKSRALRFTNQRLQHFGFQLLRTSNISEPKITSAISRVGQLLSYRLSDTDLISIAKIFRVYVEFQKVGIKANGQLLQDLWVIAEHGKTPGFFLDIGAGHPLKNSNSYNLQTYFGWRGIIIEPNPEFANLHMRLRASSKVKVFQLALTPKKSRTMDFIVAGEFSGNPKYSPGQFNEKMDEFRSKLEVTKVESDGIREFIENNRLSKIDYVNLDIEGGELSLLRAFPFESCKVHFMTVEHNYREADLDKMDAHLKSFGFKRILINQTEWDGFYINEHW